MQEKIKKVKIMCAKKNDEIIKLDETDIKILKIINDDVRISYRQISRDLGISVGTVHNRIDKMLKSGVIEKFAPVLNHKKFGVYENQEFWIWIWLAQCQRVGIAANIRTSFNGRQVFHEIFMEFDLYLVERLYGVRVY